ncbi:Coenzyme F420 hydrogenase/dehydrogenase, beta subunit C-terminal domain [Methanosphaerula palustris]|uniref:Coenzyme F420 hydrogenase/dehydrogenase beta subunit domain protein n=1 Tax=Methanosphaerula palustris (strain ATCC BAA-1556 / DSM 19958 / E1-9c) TaxID=521011 RepID=B8GFT8_METPE|nr:Coenzyme F420 hydrogenase/dehydrogenase, beta subunit C-terminal domain [Methanosphaerula palustris]ACL17971.1 coenzyme F420 hydrogenase/dehydrogenase beta subunit domain protein [Methanosphaerula palustris E1-9c]
MEERSYKDLSGAVWEKGLCAGCGACVAVCPADALCMDQGTGSSDHPRNNGYCKAANDGVPCGACYAVCPRVQPHAEESIGPVLSMHAARAAFEIEGRQSGGAVTAILVNALEEGLIDAVVTVTADQWTMLPHSTVITSSEALITGAGSRYNWWVPLLAALKEAVVTRKYKRIAIVGVPCVVQAVEQMRSSEHDLLRPYARAIRLLIGLFCTESFDYQRLMEGKLVHEFSIEPWQIRKMDVKGVLEVLLKDGNAITIPLKDLADCVRPGCHTCNDLTGVDADLSAGSVGSPEGCTTLLVRTKTGAGFVQSALDHNRLLLEGEVDTCAIEKLAGIKIRRSHHP